MRRKILDARDKTPDIRHETVENRIERKKHKDNEINGRRRKGSTIKEWSTSNTVST